MTWTNDPVFVGNPDDHYARLDKWARPAFRLGLLSSIHQAHPFEFVDEYQALFEVFQPILRRDAERLLFKETPGKLRRRKSITADDWTPFQHLKAAVPPPDFTFIGFQFQSGKAGHGVHDVGPTAFRMLVTDTAWLDATVPVEDVIEGHFELDALKTALLKIPTRSGLAGYGLSVSQDFPDNGPNDHVHAAMPVGHKFPALDLPYLNNRGWVNGSDDDPKRTWILGINWLTLVGEPFLTRLGGVKAITDGLDSRITYEVGRDTVLFQLGERPITGEAGADDDLLPLYFELGARLKPLGDGAPSMAHKRIVFHNMLAAERVAWERRFYDGPDSDWFKKG
jgi:hypothetical protein